MKSWIIVLCDTRSSWQTDYLEFSAKSGRTVRAKGANSFRTLRTFARPPIAARQISFREQGEDIDGSPIYPRVRQSIPVFSCFSLALLIVNVGLYLRAHRELLREISVSRYYSAYEETKWLYAYRELTNLYQIR